MIKAAAGKKEAAVPVAAPAAGVKISTQLAQPVPSKSKAADPTYKNLSLNDTFKCRAQDLWQVGHQTQLARHDMAIFRHSRFLFVLLRSFCFLTLSLS